MKVPQAQCMQWRKMVLATTGVTFVIPEAEAEVLVEVPINPVEVVVTHLVRQVEVVVTHLVHSNPRSQVMDSTNVHVVTLCMDTKNAQLGIDVVKDVII